ncbi:Tub_2 domain-containing protein [Cephalotus follicularis]|uniref:Tub_2 domain-containing protein n=1 Tax=Cephalotus follicularis TaxID=3775 RepID=A0A1Q3CKT3_CEPFO|nr:Tub_2 domain-containing protein [Cephalotus follicularis]
MAGESSYGQPPPAFVPIAVPVVVIDHKFCASYPVEVYIVEKRLLKITEGNLEVTDVNGNIIFKVKGKLVSLRDRRLLVDSFGNPIVSLQQKILTAHRRWEVFRGDSNYSKDLLFSVKKSSLIQFKTELDIFLAANKKENVCDFKVKGSWLERACTIYQGDSVVIAEMRKKHNLQSIVFDRDNFQICYCKCVLIMPLSWLYPGACLFHQHPQINKGGYRE